MNYLDINSVYAEISNPVPSLQPIIVEDYTPHVKPQDIDAGYIMRYFCRQSNHTDGYITEIDERTYEKLKINSLYKTVTLKWVIAGPLEDVKGLTSVNSPVRLSTGVVTANLTSLKQANEVINGLVNRLTNLKQYYTSR